MYNVEEDDAGGGRYPLGPTGALTPQGGGHGLAQLRHALRPRDGIQVVRLFGESVDILVLGPGRKLSKHQADGV